MSPKDIVINLKKIFGDATSPGQAFDAIMEIRRAGVTWDDAYKAVTTHGKALQTLQRLDESDEQTLWECPGCGVGRSNAAYCINPQCSEYKPNVETERLMRERPVIGHNSEQQPLAKFKNPVLSFGQYKGKTLTEVATINPGYLTWLEKNSTSPFWQEQARLAKIAVDVASPPARDTSDTGFFG
jgi:hypothetical protein